MRREGKRKNGNQTQRDHLLGNIKIKNGIMIERMWISSENKIKCRREKKKRKNLSDDV